MWFSHTNRKMMDEMANHATRVRRYVDRYGVDRVERFIDACLSLDSLIDYHFPGVSATAESKDAGAGEERGVADHRFPVQTPEYMESYMYPQEYVDAARRKRERERRKVLRVPASPVKDVLGFLVAYAPLEEWERDIVSIVREEALYFAPQGQTKIMNEGWAAYWHSKILTQKALAASEIVDFADHHSMAVAVHGFQINPYKLGLELFRDIEERYDRGRFGKEWDECTDLRQRRLWDRRLGLGREKIFQVRSIYNDVAFIDEFLTPQFCMDHKLFTWTYKEEYDKYIIDSTEFAKVKESLLTAITNFGHPVIHVTDSNFRNRNELLLRHTHEERDLDVKYAREVLRNLAQVWKRPVHVLTVSAGKPELWSHSGREFTQQKYSGLEETPQPEDEEG
jgi:stage V sporulation protein R